MTSERSRSPTLTTRRVR